MLPKEKSSSKRLLVSISPEAEQKLRVFAKDTGLSLSKIVDVLIKSAEGIELTTKYPSKHS